MVEFTETRSAMQVLAPVVAKAEGIQGTDYREVLKALKAKQLDKSSVLPTYRRVIAQVEATIRKQGIVTLPKREWTFARRQTRRTRRSPHRTWILRHSSETRASTARSC